jgi:hypothetical protein
MSNDRDWAVWPDGSYTHKDDFDPDIDAWKGEDFSWKSELGFDEQGEPVFEAGRWIKGESVPPKLASEMAFLSEEVLTAVGFSPYGPVSFLRLDQYDFEKEEWWASPLSQFILYWMKIPQAPKK